MRPFPRSGATHILRLRLHDVGGGVAIAIDLHHAETRRVVFSTTEMLDRDALHDPTCLSVLDMGSRLVDQMSINLSRPAWPPSQDACTFHLLNLAFRLDADARIAVRRYLMDAEPTRSALALALYLETFEQGESWNRSGHVPDQVEWSARQVLAHGVARALDLTLAGYALHYFGQNVRLAQDMLVRATELNPALAMAWDHLALFELHRGRLEQACAATGRALALSRHSPFRYAYETTRCMVASAQGDDRMAAHFGQMALARQPEFSAALRYTTASLGHLRRHAQAELLVQQILMRDPGFQAERIAAGQFRLASIDHRRRLVDGLRKSGMI